MSHYEIGRGKPPQATRFSSTNQPLRRGRRKACTDPIKILFNELFAPVEVTEHGRSRKMPKLQVVMRQLVNKSTTGDLKALNILFGILLRFSPVHDASDADVSKAKSEDAKQKLHDLVLKLAQAELQNRSEGRS